MAEQITRSARGRLPQSRAHIGTYECVTRSLLRRSNLYRSGSRSRSGSPRRTCFHRDRIVDRDGAGDLVVVAVDDADLECEPLLVEMDSFGAETRPSPFPPGRWGKKRDSVENRRDHVIRLKPPAFHQLEDAVLPGGTSGSECPRGKIV